MSESKILTLSFKAGRATPKDVEEVERYGFSAQEIADRLNRRTRWIDGKNVEARIYLYPSHKKYFIEIVPPKVTELLLLKAGAEKPSGDPAHQKVGNLSIEDVIQVAIVKKDELLTRSLKKAVKTVLGSARSVGLTVENRDPKEVIRELEQGLYDDILKKYEEDWNI